MRVIDFDKAFAFGPLTQFATYTSDASATTGWKVVHSSMQRTTRVGLTNLAPLFAILWKRRLHQFSPRVVLRQEYPAIEFVDEM